ncbi:MAG: hypothetical protein ACXWB8_12180 [Ramlibacter sp.]
MKRSFILLAAVGALAACTEKPQTISSGNRPDVQAFQGPATSFSAPGWKAGDKTSWEQQLKTRAQNQNDYNKVN